MRPKSLIIALTVLASVLLQPSLASAAPGRPTSAPAQTSSAAAQAGDDLRFLEYNICGGAGNCTDFISNPANKWRGEVANRVNRITDETGTWAADAVFLNEVCEVQYHALRPRLEALGYKGKYQRTTSSSAGCAMTDATYGTTEGVAVFVKGEVLNPNEAGHDLGTPDIKNGAVVERFILLCADTHLRGRFTKACATHQSAYGGAPAQVNVIRSLTDPWIAADLPVIVSGDVNILPGDPALATLYAQPRGNGQFIEADQTTRPAGDTPCEPYRQPCGIDEFTYDTKKPDPKKLDYIFLSKRHFQDVGGSVLHYDEMVSDHDVYRGTARWADCTPRVSLDPRGMCASSVYRLVDRATGKVASIPEGADAAGAGVTQRTWTGSAYQQWTISPSGNGYLLANRGSGLLLDGPPQPNAAGRQLLQWGPNGGANQKWQITSSGDQATVTNIETGLDVAVRDASPVENAEVVQVVGGTATPARWQLVPITYTLTNVHSDKVLAVAGGSTVRGGTAVQQTASQSTFQTWRLVAQGSGFVFVNKGSGFVLDAPEQPGAAGKQLVQWGSNEGLNQRWTIGAGNAPITLANVSTGLVADVRGDSVADGADVIEWYANGGPNQKWRLAPTA
ncbi:hypothetical protein B4N89_41560 [Embleya scabrispora]|uniref:Ricin B lectin domain-containing protein n=1 Tax=Embleya scabrispora TaxID=159449 RepID=A0A1T3NK28_9ACTN|nr:RICIN domain-containing protein [Embleya scabrispora]OPC77060.1 hypothetical protein B4N89_41560 [Embleya scabrispora]